MCVSVCASPLHCHISFTHTHTRTHTLVALPNTRARSACPIAAFVCDRGFAVEGGGSTEASATCQADGLWSVPVPVCVSQMPLTFTTDPSSLGVNCSSSRSAADDVREAVTQWLSSHGGARAQTQCYIAGNIAWSHDFDVNSADLDQACMGGLSVSVTFTASDPCMASSTTTALLRIRGFTTTTTTTSTTTSTTTTSTSQPDSDFAASSSSLVELLAPLLVLLFFLLSAAVCANR